MSRMPRLPAASSSNRQRSEPVPAATLRRRDILTAAVAGAGMLAARFAAAQQTAPPSTRAAVVIGVDKVGGLPILNGAKSGAKEVEQWLAGEGYDVTPIYDEADKPVTLKAVANAVKLHVGHANLTHLVIYFAGHGVLKGYSELWLLSGAPEETFEAISFPETYAAALTCGIPNVTFIVDACRVPAAGLVMNRMTGGEIFPNRLLASFETKVDVLLACLAGQAAAEVSESDAAGYQGIYTACLLSAFREPTDDMVRVVNGQTVVPSRKLQAYLDREVRRRAAAKPIRMNQFPATRINSDDDTYLGRALSVQKSLTGQRPAQATIIDAADQALAKAGLPTVAGKTWASAVDIEEFSQETGFARTQAVIRAAVQAPPQFDTGFTVVGAFPAAVVTPPSVQSGLVVGSVDGGSGSDAGVRVDLGDRQACSVGLQFGDGSGTVLAALRGFVGTVVVDRRSIVNVSYTPSPSSPLWYDFDQARARLTDMRAAVAATVRYGAFQIDGDRATRERKAAELAGSIRPFKSIDPTLGLYAAYAYAEANLPDQVRSVNQFMRGDLHVEIFDVKLLTGELGRVDESVVPFCPMLAQGWGLLRAKGARLADEVAAARDYVLTSPWTMLSQAGMDIIVPAIKEGRLR